MGHRTAIRAADRPARRILTGPAAAASAALVLVCLVLTAPAGESPAAAPTAVKLALDWKFEGPAAPYLEGIDEGFYAAEGLDVRIDTGSGSVEGINRVAAGTYQFAFADINSLIKFRDKNPAKAVKAVLMVYDAPPFAIAPLGQN